MRWHYGTVVKDQFFDLIGNHNDSGLFLAQLCYFDGEKPVV